MGGSGKEGVKGFIVYPTYVVEDGVPKVRLYGRLEDGRSFLSVHEERPYFFVRRKDEGKVKALCSFSIFREQLRDFDRLLVSRVVVGEPKDVPPLRDALHREGVPTFEADVRFEYRFLIDKGLRGAVNVVGRGRDGGEFGVDVVFEEATVEPLPPDDYVPKNLRVLSFDIETDKEGGGLYSIAVVTNEGFETVLMRSEGKVRGAETFPSEKEVLERFLEVVREQDPDVLVGWNVVDFDLAELARLCRRHKVVFALGRGGGEVRLRRYESFFRESKADCPGRIVLDGIAVLRGNFIKMDDYKLSTVAKHYVGEDKLFSGPDRYKQIDEAFRKDPALLAKYNRKDATLVLQVLEKSGAFDLTVRRSLLTGMPLDRVSASIASLDQLYLHELRKKGFVAPTGGFREREARTVGGYVMQSKPGIYEYVLVCDFKSLYPSIMRTFNIDPLMFEEPCKKNSIKAPNGACFRREEGILPAIIAEILARREAATKKGDALARFALKILMNSFYGVMASPSCRFYNPKIANAITSFARMFIQMLERRLRGLGYSVIYGDTDSLFIDLKERSLESAEEAGRKLVREANLFLREYIKKEYRVESFLELEFEKVFVRFLMPRARHGVSGAKKRYAGLLRRDGKEELEFVGLEFVRRDWTDLAKKFQSELLNKIFHNEEVESYVQGFVRDVREGKYDDLLVYRKAIRKELDKYTKTTPPHVKAARKLKKLDSSLIEYVMTKKGPEPVGLQSAPIDYDHYIEKQLRPIADALLVFGKRSFDEIVKGDRQMSLEKF
ncbi:DNA polymerase II [Candidatus Woesearchaeota archaeon]|nr:MAG: DNA polymerase II [Candidatus Woesearchaeota archaeon]